MKILPLTSVSACSSWLVIAQGGGGALLLVLLNVDSADPYKQTMTLLEDIPPPLLIYISVFLRQALRDSPRQRTCGPLRWQVLRLPGTLWDATMGG